MDPPPETKTPASIHFGSGSSLAFAEKGHLDTGRARFAQQESTQLRVPGREIRGPPFALGNTLQTASCLGANPEFLDS